MDLEELKADIMSLRKLYRLFEINEDGIRNMASKNLDERAWLLLRNLLDGAAQKLFEQFIKCDQASPSPTQATPKPNPSHGFTPLHSSTEAIHSRRNAKSRSDKHIPSGPHPSKPISSDRSRLADHPPQKCIIHHSQDRRPLQFTEEKRENYTLPENRRMKENSTLRHRARDPYLRVKEPPLYDPRGVKYHHSEYIPAEVGNSDEGSWTSPLSRTSISGRSYSNNCSSNSSNNSSSVGGEDESETSNSESENESSDRFSRSEGRSYGLSGSEGRLGVVWGRKSRFRVGKNMSRSRSRSSYHTYSGFLKKPFGRLRKLRNKLALIFHHHHHHHHHHGSVEWSDRAEGAPDQARRRQRQRPEGKAVVRIEEMVGEGRKGKAIEGRRKGGKQKGNFGALLEGLKRHVKSSRKMKKKKKLKHPKLEKRNGSFRELRWWKRLQKRRGGRGGKALEKRMRHELLEGKDENASF